MHYRILDWDSSHFGFPIARLDRELCDEEFGTFEGWCRDNYIRCAYLLTEASPAALSWAIQKGFSFQDVRITLDHALKAIPSFSPDTRSIEPADFAKLVEKGPAIFRQSRFFQDVRFPRARSVALYEIWIQNCCRVSDSQASIVSGPVGNPQGFITCDLTKTGEGHIGLYGTFEFPGLGQKLLAHALSWFRERAALSVYVVTQGSAIAAQRSYQKAGFRTKSIEFWFHRWFS